MRKIIITATFVIGLSFSSLYADGPIKRINSASANTGLRTIKNSKVFVPEIKNSDIKIQTKTNTPLVAVIHGLDCNEIGFIIELKHIKYLLNLFSSNRALLNEGVSEQDAVAFIEEAIGEEVKATKRAKNYAVDLMEEAKVITGVDAKIVKVDWSLDPGDTYSVVKKVKKELIALSKTANDENRPFYILSFSWGTVIMHEALNALHAEKEEVYVDKLFTLGSPLIPSGFITKLFIAAERIKEQLSRKVKRPANAGKWINLYADNDGFSGLIPQADLNIRVDAPSDETAKRINETQAGFIAKKSDLAALKKSITWHMAYFYNVNIPLKTLHTDYRQDLVYEYSPLYLSR